MLLAASFGCAQTVPSRQPAAGHGYALLHEILGQERKVSQLLFIKGERPELDRVIGEISEVSDAAYERLEELAEKSPRLDLSDPGLPADEVETREGVAAQRRDQLLAARGREFELQLLWAQNEALTYGAQLADTLSRSEPDAERLAFLRALWQDLARLREAVQALLRHPEDAGA
jgi:hypothetical protein